MSVSGQGAWWSFFGSSSLWTGYGWQRGSWPGPVLAGSISPGRLLSRLRWSCAGLQVLLRFQVHVQGPGHPVSGCRLSRRWAYGSRSGHRQSLPFLLSTIDTVLVSFFLDYVRVRCLLALIADHMAHRLVLVSDDMNASGFSDGNDNNRKIYRL